MAYVTGIGGCCGRTKRRGTARWCAQKAIVTVKGMTYCYYHNPNAPKKFGEGYVTESRRYAKKK